MKIIVTGGAGFIGSNFIQYLRSNNKQVYIINIDKLTYAGNTRNLGIEEDPNYRFYKEDICNFSAIDSIFTKHKPQYVINFAAESHVDRSIVDSKVFIETNVLGTQVLLQAALKHKVERFIQISTDEVYGASTDYCFTELDALHPGNPYAASKAAADMLALSYKHTYGLPVSITRCTNNFGPFQHNEKLIPMVIDKCLKGERIPIYGNGMQMRDWIFVEDHCRAVLDVLYKGGDGEIYNISANNRICNRQLVIRIIQELKMLMSDRDVRKSGIDEGLISYVEDRKGHDWCYSINADKIKSQLGWQSVHDFDKALSSTIRWYLGSLTNL